MELWVAITVAAAFVQNLRTTLQKHLKSVMGTAGATFVRFGFGLPFAAAFVLALSILGAMPVPAPGARFLFWIVVAGLSQIIAQALLIQMFAFRNFVVGNAYSRTEPAQAAIFGLLFLGENAGLVAFGAIALTVLGVGLISVSHGQSGKGAILRGMFNRPAAIGLLSGAFFGVAAVGYRAASLSLGGPGFVMQAATTLLWAIGFQTVVMGLWIIWRDRAEFRRIARAWKPSLATGLVGAAASFGWFAAMTLQQAAVVKAVAQVEILFSIASSVLFFREKITWLELAGVALIIVGIVGLLLWR